MGWTYSGDPNSTDRDAVRFRVADVDENEQLVTDEEIAYAIGLRGSVGAAAAFVAKAIALRFARAATAVQRGRLREEYAERAATYERLAEALAEEAGDSPSYVAGLLAPATTVAGVAEADSDTSRTRGVFAIGMHDWPAGRNENDVYEI